MILNHWSRAATATSLAAGQPLSTSEALLLLGSTTTTISVSSSSSMDMNFESEYECRLQKDSLSVFLSCVHAALVGSVVFRSGVSGPKQTPAVEVSRLRLAQALKLPFASFGLPVNSCCGGAR